MAQSAAPVRPCILPRPPSARGAHGLPFFVLHQPVIIVLAYYAVQWHAPLLVKLLFVVLGSFCVTLGLFEVLVRRSGVLRLAFGVKRAA